MIEEKYRIEYFNHMHVYSLDLVNLEYHLDKTSPIYFEIDNKKIEERTWTNLIGRIANYLITKHNPRIEELLMIRFHWTKQAIFLCERTAPTHYGPLCNNLYINTNLTATHLCWTVIDLLIYFKDNLSECKLIIRRPPGTEKKEVIDYFLSNANENLRWFLKRRLSLYDDKIENILSAVVGVDHQFRKHFPVYYSVLLFESKLDYASCKARFKAILKKEITNEKHLNIYCYILDVLTQYYGYVAQNKHLNIS